MMPPGELEGIGRNFWHLWKFALDVPTERVTVREVIRTRVYRFLLAEDKKIKDPTILRQIA